jgi:hypothetical protein
MSAWEVGCTLMRVRMDVMSRLGMDWMMAKDGGGGGISLMAVDPLLVA